MTFVIVLSVILALILVALLLPLTLEINFNESFNFSVNYIGFKIYPKQRRNNGLNSFEDKNTDNSKKDNFLKKLFDENTFLDFLQMIISFLKTIFKQIRFFLKHIKVKKFKINVVVSSKDASTTAINYGVVSTLIYNFVKYIDSITNLKIKQINISSDFEGTKSKFDFYAKIYVSPLFLLVIGVVITKKYIELTNRKGSAVNERK